MESAKEAIMELIIFSVFGPAICGILVFAYFKLAMLAQREKERKNEHRKIRKTKRPTKEAFGMQSNL